MAKMPGVKSGSRSESRVFTEGRTRGLVQGGRLSVSMPHIGAVKAEEISIVACTEGLAGPDEIGHMWRQHAPSGSRTARSKTRCAQDLMSRCISIGVNVKIRH